MSNGTSSNFTEMDLKSVISSQSFPVVIEGQVDIHRENAALTVLCRNDDLYDLLETIQSVQDRFNDKHHYDWVFLNDNEFTVEFMYSVASLLGEGEWWHQVWSGPARALGVPSVGKPNIGSLHLVNLLRR